MRFLRAFFCFLFLLASSMAPAMAMPHCDTMNMASVQDKASQENPHCDGMSGEKKEISKPSDPAPDTVPYKCKDCCGDDTSSQSCNMKCKSMSQTGMLVQPMGSLAFEAGELNTLPSAFVALHIPDITTPPPKSCS